MTKEELKGFYNSNKEMDVRLNSWGFTESIKLEDLFKIFKMLMEEEKVDP